MKRLIAFGCWAASGLIHGAPTARTSDEPQLPAWNANERTQLESGGWVPGAILLTDDPIPDETAAPAAGPLDVEQPKPEEIANDLKASPEIPEEFLAEYFAKRPATFLVDPQGLLGASEYRDRLGFLNYHGTDSSIDLFVYVIGGDQDVPTDVRKEETIERFFAEGKPAAIVYYYLGAPQRSAVYLSPSITDSIPAAEQRRALESSVMQAFEKTKPSEQFEKFLVQMSIRIYWMERVLSGNPSPVVVATVHQPSAEKLAKNAKIEFIWQMAERFAMPAAMALGGFLTVFGLVHWFSLRVRYRFPEFEVEPRLGGAHAAGIGAVISFASAALPPASQRDQVPDYLRRA